MTASVEATPEVTIDDLSYFVSWGGEAASSLFREALDDFLGRDLRGLRVLEVGAGNGKMSTLFALLGANVTGVDVECGFERDAQVEAFRAGVADRVRFERCDGSLKMLPDNHYDLVFTKSMLLYIHDLEPFLREIAKKLKPNGRVCFLENRPRNVLDRWFRCLVHAWRGTRNYHYTGRTRLEIINRVFDTKPVKLRMNSALGSRMRDGTGVWTSARHRE